MKYFHPAFHSTTPEGLNSRLTFLLQCTRQGRTLEDQGANNLAFGRPPVCILRIGDFYNTKIIIDNIGITYEPLVWDLNPEGIGVQPMIANVDISFKFIGGSSLMGPINKLQNALSFNYFANSRVYDPRADYIAKKPQAAPSEASKEPIINNDTTGVNVDVQLDDVTVKAPFRSSYNLVDGDKDISEDSIEFKTQFLSMTESSIDQEASNDNTLNNAPEVETPSVDTSATTLSITGMKLATGISIVKDESGWDIPVILTYDGNVADLDTTAENVFAQGTFKLRIKDVNSKEMYEDLIVSADELKMFMHPFEGSILRIPNSKDVTFMVTGGIKDSLGKERYYLAFVKDDKELFRLNVLLP